MILIILILLFLTAGYYVWKVYDGDPNELIGRLFSGIRPTAESVLTKIPETISDMDSVLTKIPEMISDIAMKPTAVPVTQPTSPVSRVTAPTPVSKPSAGKPMTPGIIPRQRCHGCRIFCG